MISRIAAVLILGAAIGSIWIVLSFARVGLAGEGAERATEPTPDALPPILERGDAPPARAAALSRRETIVYVSEGDTTFFHGPGHLAHDAPRQGISVACARTRGLVPCSLCFRGRGEGLQPVATAPR